MRHRRSLVALSAAVVLAGTGLGSAAASTAAGPASGGHGAPTLAGGFKHLVVIYEENHSFDNLYGGWGRVGRDRVDGPATAPRSRTAQVAQDGTRFGCLQQLDVNLTSPPLAVTCTDAAHGVAGAFPNAPFRIDDHIAPTDTTCPAPTAFGPPNGVPKGQGLPGGCTRDLVHRFYNEQFQLDGGRQDRYVLGSDAAGLAMGGYDTRALPVYQYLHTRGAPHYVIADRFFQAAFGGSFLNHQWLVAARSPLDTSATDPDGTPGPHDGLHSVLDANGMPATTPLYTPVPVAGVAPADRQLTQSCSGPATDPSKACGDYAVNTIQPTSNPHGGGAQLPTLDDRVFPTIGDRLSDAGYDWNWYSGGWDAAAAGTPEFLFQYHHQPLNYFANFAEGGKYRSHLQDETKFIAAAQDGTLPTVSFVKPVGEENEHPGYTGEHPGSNHLVGLLRAVNTGPQAEDTLVVVTYDEFGGQWDHVPPPGQGSVTQGVSDQWGPGTRIPALLVSAAFDRSGVDHTVYDTTSILATIERGLHLAPLSSRDARVADLRPAVRVGSR